MNLNFKEWLLSEMGDILSRDVAHINLQSYSNGYFYKFTIEGINFIVNFSKAIDYTFNTKNVYSITFEGPNSYYSTNQSGTTANVIYAQLLLAVKKLFETTQVDGLQFTPAEPKMGLLYRRFFNQYLKKDFIHAAPSLFLRKTVLRDILSKQDKGDRESNLRNIMRTGRESLQKVKEVKELRLKILALKKAVGTFVYFESYGSNTKVGYLQSIDPANDEARVMYVSEKAYSDSYSLNKIDVTNKPSTEEIIAILKDFADFRKNKPIQKHLEKDEKLKQFFKQYNIEIASQLEEMKKKLHQFLKDQDDGSIYYVQKIDEYYDDHIYITLVELNKRLNLSHLSYRALEHTAPANSNDIQRFLMVASDIDRHDDSKIEKIIEEDENIKKLFDMHNIKIKPIEDVNLHDYVNQFFRLKTENTQGIFYVTNVVYDQPRPNKLKILINEENYFYVENLYLSDFKEYVSDNVTKDEVTEFIKNLAAQQHDYYIRDIIDNKLEDMIRDFEAKNNQNVDIDDTTPADY